MKKSEKKALLKQYLSSRIVDGTDNSSLQDVLSNIPAKNLYPYVFEVYDDLDAEHNFDTNSAACYAMVFALCTLVSHYHASEYEKSDSRSQIPSAMPAQFSQFCQSASFTVQYMRLQSFLHLGAECPGVESSPREKFFGLLNKLMQARAQASEENPFCFKNVLFNNPGQVRKFMTSIESSPGGTNRYFFLGTRKQLFRARKRFEVDSTQSPEISTLRFG